MKRIGLFIVVLFVLSALVGCQSAVAPAPLNAVYDSAGPLTVGEMTEVDGECLLPLQGPYAYSGDLEGTMHLDYHILLHGPCDPEGQIGDLNESWIVTGHFDGAVAGRVGTFEVFYIADITDRHFTGQMAIVPGSATDELRGLRGLINFDEMIDDPAPWPVTGYYYFVPETEGAQPATEDVSMSTDAPLPDGNTAAAVEAAVKAVMDEYGVPGVAIGIVRDGELVYAEGFGTTTVGGEEHVTPATNFLLSSIAKTVTTTSIMQLMEQGKVDLNAPVTDYLPYFQMADDAAAPITLAQLLMHRSGLPDNEWTDMSIFHNPRDDEAALEDHIVQSLQNATLLNPPGADFNYSGLGFDALGDVVAKVSGQPFEDYAAEHVLAPLGMNDTTMLAAELDWDTLAMPHIPNGNGQIAEVEPFPYTRYMAPDSVLYSSINDMAKYVTMHLKHGENDGALLAPATYEAMWTDYSETPFPPPETSYGYGWQLGEYQGERVVGHSGIDIGYNSFIALLPEHDTGLIVMTNFDDLDNWVMPAFMLREPLLDIVLAMLRAE